MVSRCSIIPGKIDWTPVTYSGTRADQPLSGHSHQAALQGASAMLDMNNLVSLRHRTLSVSLLAWRRLMSRKRHPLSSSLSVSYLDRLGPVWGIPQPSRFDIDCWIGTAPGTTLADRPFCNPEWHCGSRNGGSGYNAWQL